MVVMVMLRMWINGYNFFRGFRCEYSGVYICPPDIESSVQGMKHERSL